MLLTADIDKGTNEMGSGDVDGGADCRVLPYVLCRKMKIKS